MSLPTFSTIGACCEAGALLITAATLFGVVLFGVMRLRQAAATVDHLLSFEEETPAAELQPWQQLHVLDEFYPETPRRRRSRAIKQETAAQLGLYPRRRV
jgi:hypothetical protein